MKIRNTLSAFVGSVITSVLGETNMRSFVMSCIAADLKTRGDQFAEMISENIDTDHVSELAAEKIAENIDISNIAEEIRDNVKGDLDADTIAEEVKDAIKDDIDTDDIKDSIAEAMQRNIDTDDIADNVKQEIIDGIDSDFEALVVEEISGKICPDNVAELVATELSDKGDFSECVKREVIAILARQFAEQHTEDFKSAVRTLAQGAQSVLTAAQEVLGTAASKAADAAIGLGEALESGSREEVIVAASALMVAEYEQALADANVASIAYTKALEDVKAQQDLARSAEDAMSNTNARLMAAQRELTAARIDIRQECKNTL